MCRIPAAVVAALFVATTPFVTNVLAQESPVPLKAGPGYEAVEGYCGACHSLDYPRTNAPFLNRQGWETEVNKMIKVFGAPIEPADAKISRLSHCELRNRRLNISTDPFKFALIEWTSDSTLISLKDANSSVPYQSEIGDLPRPAAVMRRMSICFFVFWMAGSFAWGQAASTTTDASKGRHWQSCYARTCHVVAPDQPYAPTLNPPAASFESIAQRAGTTVEFPARLLDHHTPRSGQSERHARSDAGRFSN